MTARDIGNILTQLKKTDRFQHRRFEDADGGPVRQTRFGVPLMRTDEDTFTIDMSGIHPFTGISKFAQMLSARFFETAWTAVTDVTVTLPVTEEITPELAALNARQVSLQVRYALVDKVVAVRAVFPHMLRSALGAIQNEGVRDLLFVPANRTSTAWLFPFEALSTGSELSLLLEYDPGGHFLRMTIEDRNAHRLFLKRIPHRVVSTRECTFFSEDVQTLAEKMLFGIHHAFQNQRESYKEEPSRLPNVFERLAVSGLQELSALRFAWNNRDISHLLADNDTAVRALIAKTLLLLEDNTVLATLAEMSTIEMLSGDQRSYLDLSRRGTCLNIALSRRRARPDLPGFLLRMPRLNSLIQENAGAFKNVRVVFVHHLTAETLGCICGLQQAGCAHLHGLFIRYKGVTADSYLEALMTLPARQFVFHSLHNLGDDESLSGHYVVSSQFSPVAMLQPLADVLRKTSHDYTSAMRKAAGHILLRQLFHAKKERQQVLLIEDGGYMAPQINRWALLDISLGAALKECCLDPEEMLEILPGQSLDVPLRDWISEVLPATVEHTRNGYDQLAEVKQHFSALAVPAYTMALSDYKNIEEGRGAAMSVLMACEAIMNSQGDSMYCRHGCVIGSRGNIGRFLLQHLHARLEPGHCLGIDIQCDAAGRGMRCDAPEYAGFADLPPGRLEQLDLIIGITGHSVLQPEQVRHWLLHGEKQRLYLASGSTKAIEFADVVDGLQHLRESGQPVMDGQPVRIETSPVVDPLTEIIQGTRIRVYFTESTQAEAMAVDTPFKDILLLADGMPLNFNFYGVPCEIIDNVMRQLIQMSLLAVHPCGGRQPVPDIYALDCNINELGEPLQGHPLP